MRIRHRAALALAGFLAAATTTPVSAQPASDPMPHLRFGVIASNGSQDSLFAGDSLIMRAATCGPCGRFTGAASPDGVPTFELELRPDSCLITVCLPVRAELPIGPFAAGSHRMLVVGHIRTADSSGVRQDTVRTYVEFAVRTRELPPPSDSLPYGIRTCVGSQAAGVACRDTACPGEGVLFTLQGEFPTSCHRVRSFSTVPSMGPLEVWRLDLIRCGDVCLPMQVPFRRQGLLGPRAPGEHAVRLLVVERDCADSTVVAGQWETTVRYAVAERCTTPDACVFPFMSAASTQPCAAVLSPAGDASVDLALQSSVEVSGLEGEIEVQAPLVVTGVDAIGAAAGMRALWQRTEQGARWALLGFDGQRLPPLAHERVLRVKVGVPTDGPRPERMRVAVNVTVASDSLGGKVPLCDISTMRFADPAAIVCSRRSCDANGDGIENVRDLVTLVRCLRQPGACPDSVARPDCDFDGHFGLDDVLCCARRILRGSGTDTLPPRPGDGLALRFGDPVRTLEGVELPLALEGSETLGDARLTLAFPGERFEFDAAAFEGDESGWLSIAESRSPGRVTLALINVGGSERTLPMRLYLRLRSGAEAEGTVTVDGGEFRAADGARLTTVVAGTSSAALGTAAPRPVGLSAARPNPFGSTTRFAVTLAREADAEVSVHDLAGRRVALLHRGTLPAGSRDFVWDGRGEQGARLAGGLYFVRLRVAGDVVSRSVVLLGTR